MSSDEARLERCVLAVIPGILSCVAARTAVGANVPMGTVAADAVRMAKLLIQAMDAE